MRILIKRIRAKDQLRMGQEVRKMWRTHPSLLSVFANFAPAGKLFFLFDMAFAIRNVTN